MMNKIEDTDAVIFGDNVGGALGSDDANDEYINTILRLVDDAQAYENDYCAPDREQADAYFKGTLPSLTGEDVEDQTEEAGRSTVVATEVRDTIMAIMPSLIRIFTASEKPVEFVATNKYTVELAQQQTDYVSHVFMEDNEGFMIIYNILMDSLNKGVAAVQWWSHDDTTVVERSYEGITEEQAQFVLSQPNTELVEAEQYEDGSYDILVRAVDKSNRTVVETVPPEEIRIDRRAHTYKTAKLFGRRRTVDKSFLVSRGYSNDWVKSKFSNSDSVMYVNTVEQDLRNSGSQDGYFSDTEIDFGEYWVRVDGDGDGVDELHYVHVIGDDVTHDEVVSGVKMALFTPDPEPHTTRGRSINESVQDLQRIKTNILRTTLDSLAQTIHGRLAVVENMVNMDDVLNDDIGAPIRVKGPNSIEPVGQAFVGQPAIEMMGYLDTIRQARTGISEASKGLDPKALQSTNVNAVDMVITGAQERIELIARILAETGLKDTFKGILIEVTENPNKPRTLKLRGEWVEVNPDVFDPTMGVQVNPAIGRGSDIDRFNMLSNIAAKQEAVIDKMGITNPFVTPQEYINTITDMLAIAGIKNVSRYFKMPTPEQIEQLVAAMNKPGPAAMLAQSEAEKNRVNLASKIADDETKRQKIKSDDDFRRDKLESDIALSAAKLGVSAFDILNRTTLARDAEGNAVDRANADRELAAEKEVAAAMERNIERDRDDQKTAAEFAERQFERATAAQNAAGP